MLLCIQLLKTTAIIYPRYVRVSVLHLNSEFVSKDGAILGVASVSLLPSEQQDNYTPHISISLLVP